MLHDLFLSGHSHIQDLYFVTFVVFIASLARKRLIDSDWYKQKHESQTVITIINRIFVAKTMCQCNF
jgi:hypothetical protein